MNPKFTRALFKRWYKVAPSMGVRWLNYKLERAEQASARQRELEAADELEIQCEEAELPIRHHPYMTTTPELTIEQLTKALIRLIESATNPTVEKPKPTINA